MPTAFVHRIAAAGPDDVIGLAAAIAAGRIDPSAVVAVLGKTEGNGCVNDFTRSFALAAMRQLFAAHLPPAAVAEICFVMSGGTEGALSPHWLVFERRDAAGGATPSLAIGRAHTPDLPAPHLGRREQALLVADGVRAAMADAGISDAADVHFVQVKCPLLTLPRIRGALAEGASLSTRDTLKSMGLSRGASAIGVGFALGEIAPDDVTDARIAGDVSVWSGRASASAGVELLNHEIVVLGMSKAWQGPLVVDHAVMADAIDIEPVRAALTRLGITTSGQVAEPERPRVIAVLAKAEAALSGQLRGHRTTMLDDSDISSTRHARAFVAGVLAGLVGHAELFVSGGAEHQGPDGGGPVAVIVARDTGR